MTGFANQQCKYSAFLQNMKKYRNNFTDFPSSDTLSFPVRGKTKRGIRFCGHPSSSLVRIPDDPLLGYDADIGTILEQRRHQLELVARIDDHFLQCRIALDDVVFRPIVAIAVFQIDFFKIRAT